MAIKGSLQEASLPDIIQMLSMAKKTGILRITDNEKLARIYFSDGMLVGADMVNRENRIGDMLKTAGVITAQELQEALNIQKETGEILGNVLIDMGKVDEDTIKNYLKRQIKETIFNLFGWEKGEFHFEPNESVPERGIRVKVKSDDVLLEAARLIDELSVVEMPDYDKIVLKTEKIPEKLPKGMKGVYKLIGNESTLEEIVDRGGMDEYMVLKNIANLVKEGYIKKGPRKEEIGKKKSKISEHQNLGLAFLQMEMYEEAEREFNRILEISPNDVIARFYTGIIFSKLGDYKKAIEQFKNILKGGFECPALYNNIGVFYELMEDYDNAINILNEGKEKFPDNSYILMNLAISHFKAGNIEQSITFFDAALKIKDDLPPCYFYWAIILLQKGETEHALNMLLKGAVYNPPYPQFYNNLGRIYEISGEYDKAEEMYKKAEEINPKYEQAIRNLGEFYYRNAFYDSALEEMKKLIEIGKADGDIYFKLGNIYIKNGEKEMGLKMWEEALKLEPDNAILKRNIEMLKYGKNR